MSTMASGLTRHTARRRRVGVSLCCGCSQCCPLSTADRRPLSLSSCEENRTALGFESCSLDLSERAACTHLAYAVCSLNEQPRFSTATLPGGSRGNGRAISVLVVADINGDGLDDLVAGSFASGVLEWHASVGEGSLASPTGFGRVLGVSRIQCRDLDRDGDVDCLSASRSERTVYLHENRGKGVFSPQTAIHRANYGAVTDMVGRWEGGTAAYGARVPSGWTHSLTPGGLSRRCSCSMTLMAMVTLIFSWPVPS